MKMLWKLIPALAWCCLVLQTEQAFSQPTFVNKINIPPIIDAADDTIRLVVKRLTVHQFNPANPSDTINGIGGQVGIETWAFNAPDDTTMTILGPTIKWHTGQPTHIRVTNELGVPVTSHWHGAEVPAEMDGGPHQPIQPGTTWPVDFINLDSASTMWYHPHIHNETFPQVQMGLSGMIISEQESDTIRPKLPHTYGVDDIPLIIGDQGFKQVTIDDETIMAIDTTKATRPFNLVNGVTNPFYEVPAHLVRLRILNGSTRKGLIFGVSSSYTDTMITNFDDFILVATDGGYTLKPDTMKTLLTGPGARAELILDLTDMQPGDVVYLRNLKHLLPKDIVGSELVGQSDTTRGNAFIQLRVVADPPDYTPVDEFFSFRGVWDPTLADTIGIDRHRTKRLIGMGQGKGYTIDSLTFDMQYINDTICVGAKEIWTIKNESNVAHPFHIHKIFFRVLDVQDAEGNYLDLDSLGFNGPKDDILVRAGWTLRFLSKFDDYPNAIVPELSYMYHCHILTHEDATGGGMMHQFVVTDQGACMPSSNADPESFIHMSLFPNPARNEVFLGGRAEKTSQVRIIDLSGKVLLEQSLPPFEGVIPISLRQIPKGYHFIQWRTAVGQKVQPLVVQ